VSAGRAAAFRRLCRAGDLLRAPRDRPVSVREAAAAAGMSPFHFIRRFRALFGETPRQFLIRARIDRAKVLLASSDRSVTDVCLEVGFTSLGSFSDLFARRVGVAPSVYRRRVRARAGGAAPGCLTLMAPAFATFEKRGRAVAGRLPRS
jgi:AraC-like DNA-binding protein